MDKKYMEVEVLNLKRSALVLSKKKMPYYDWLQSIGKGSQNSNTTDNEVYLLPDYEEIDQMEKWLSRNFDFIFQDQLNGWITDQDLWIKNRTYKLFKEWFDYSLHTMIFDLEKGEIEKI